MIEYDETEYLHSAVPDELLIAVRGFYFDEPQVADKLLYRGDAPRLNFSKSSTQHSRTG